MKRPEQQGDQQGEVWTDEQWQLYVAELPPILRPADFKTVPDWMLYQPQAFPRRFDTHFFFASMPAEQQAKHDQLETTQSIWIRPDEALSRYQEGQEGGFPLVYATIRQLQALCDLDSIDAVRQRFASGPLPTIRPRIIQYGGRQVIVAQERPGNGDPRGA